MREKKRRKRTKLKERLLKRLTMIHKEEQVSQSFSFKYFIKRFNGLFKNIKPY